MRAAFLNKLIFLSVLTIFCGFNALFSSGELIGSSHGEVYGHAWTHWWRGEIFPSWSSGTDMALGVSNMPAIDPLPSLLSILVGKLFGVVFGYNFLIFCAVFLAAYGGWVLAESVDGDPYLGAIALALAPAFLGSIRSGLTEDAALGLLALAISCIFRSKIILAGFFIGLLAWCGLLLAWLGGLCCFIIGLFRIKELKIDPRSLFLSVLLIFLLAFSAASFHADRLLSTQDLQHAGVFESNWILNPSRQIDFMSLFVPSFHEIQAPPGRTHPGYLGFSLLFLALFSKQRLVWFVLFIFVGLALGPEVRVFGHPFMAFNPVHWLLDFFPGADRVNHHGRALLSAAVVLSLLAAGGARVFHRWRFQLRTLVLLELCLLSPISPVLPITPVSDSVVLNELADLPPGNVLVLPPGGPGISPQQSLWHQHIHEKKLLLDPNRSGMPNFLLSSNLMTWLNGLGFHQNDFEGELLLNPNVNYLLVHKQYAHRLTKLFGKALLEDDRFSLWDAYSVKQK